MKGLVVLYLYIIARKIADRKVFPTVGDSYFLVIVMLSTMPTLRWKSRV